jgi:serine/threonine protein kinase
MRCPTCNRVFAPGSVACPYDGTALVDQPSPSGSWAAETMAQPEPGIPTPPPLTSQRPKVRATTQSRAAEGHRTGPAEPARTGSRPRAAAADGTGRVTAAMAPSAIRQGGSQPRAMAPAPAAPPPAEPTGPAVRVQPAAQPLVPYPSVPANIELEPGTMVGEYQITGLLGTGGMGSVYAGVQPVIGKKVAIKVLLRELATNPQVVNRFQQEARAVNQAQSRFIVDIFSFGELPDQRQYFVMEYLEGQSLRHFLRERKALDFDEAFSILSCVCRGLIAAHNKGIIHRDIKPENIVVSTEEDGALTAKLLDFGIAKLQSGEGSQPGFATRTGAAMGTPYYMSPEQCRGSGVDHRTDIYALGIIMFEMFTGALPFNARSYIDLVNKHLYASPPSPSKLRNNISPVLEGLILRCIGKDPAERPDSVEQVLHELQQAAPSLRGTSFNLESPAYDPTGEVVPPELAAQGGKAKRTAAGKGEGKDPGKAAPAASGGSGLKVALIIVLVLVLLGGGAATAYFVLKNRTRGGSGGGVAAGSGSGSALLGGAGSGSGSAAAQQTILQVTTKPTGARVFLDGAAQPGTTPLELHPSPGTHELRIELAGHKVSNESVTVQPGQRQAVSFVLITAAEPVGAQTGSLRVRTGVDRASYSLDGADVGSGAELQTNVKAGSHQLHVSAPGYLPLEQTITVDAGGTTRLELQLHPSKRPKTPKNKGGKVEKGQGGSTSEDPDGTLNPFKRKH